jgi:hypothetical protein
MIKNILGNYLIRWHLLLNYYLNVVVIIIIINIDIIIPISK